MKKNRIFTSILAMALVLIAVIVVVITVGLFRTTKEETLEGQAETTDYRLSSKVPARVPCSFFGGYCSVILSRRGGKAVAGQCRIQCSQGYGGESP